MTKKAPTLTEIVDQLHAQTEQEKVAADVTTSEKVVIDLLQKVAAELKTYNSEVTYDELNQFIKGTK